MDEPIAISLYECARLLSVTRKHVYHLIANDPDFPRTFKLGRWTRVMRSEVPNFIAQKAKRPAELAERLQLGVPQQGIAGTRAVFGARSCRWSQFSHFQPLERRTTVRSSIMKSHGNSTPGK